MGYTVSPAEPVELEIAARLLCGRGPAHETPARIERFLAAVADGDVDPAGILLARHRGQPVGVAVVQFLPGGSAVVLPPLPVGRSADALADDIIARLRDQNTPLAYTFLDPDEADQADPLVRRGFRAITRITHMLRTGVPAPPPSDRTDVRLEPVGDDFREFGETLLATYEGTLDVPEACFDRPSADILAGYRVHQPTPPHWWLARDPAGRPIGTLILTVTRTPNVWELGYLGVVPLARGRRVGEAMLRFALRAAADLGVHDLTLSVDERNEPALQLYRGRSFQSYQWQQVFLWRPSW
jgi:GNAT superfamily N-acetyltransferase